MPYINRSVPIHEEQQLRARARARGESLERQRGAFEAWMRGQRYAEDKIAYELHRLDAIVAKNREEAGR